MNYIYILFEIIFTFFLMLVFYKISKKDGLYLYIVLMSSILSIIMFKSIDLFSFQVNLGIPIIVSLFICNNIIIQRFGIDEVKKIICYFASSYIMVMIIICLGSLALPSEYNNLSSLAFDSLFGYNLSNFRCFIGGLLSIGFMLYLNGEVYYYIRKSKNKLFLSNLGSILIIQFIESIIFVFISYLGEFDFLVNFGMIIGRYLLKVIIGFILLIATHLLVNKRGR